MRVTSRDRSCWACWRTLLKACCWNCCGWSLIWMLISGSRIRWGDKCSVIYLMMKLIMAWVIVVIFILKVLLCVAIIVKIIDFGRVRKRIIKVLVAVYVLGRCWIQRPCVKISAGSWTWVLVSLNVVMELITTASIPLKFAIIDVVRFCCIVRGRSRWKCLVKSWVYRTSIVSNSPILIHRWRATKFFDITSFWSTLFTLRLRCMQLKLILSLVFYIPCTLSRIIRKRWSLASNLFRILFACYDKISVIKLYILLLLSVLFILSGIFNLMFFIILSVLFYC